MQEIGGRHGGVGGGILNSEFGSLNSETLPATTILSLLCEHNSDFIIQNSSFPSGGEAIPTQSAALDKLPYHSI